MNTISNLTFSSRLQTKRIPRVPNVFLWHLKQWLFYRWRELPLLFVLAIRSLIPGLCVVHGCLRMKLFKRDGTVVDFGIVGRHLVTTAGKNFIVDAFQNSVELENMKFHGIGTGTTAAAVGDTALETELTTEYQTDNTRATGTTTEGGSANIYRSVATNTVDASVAITEWGALSQAATGGGTLLDRQVFSAVNLSNGESLQTTYDLTVG